MYLAWRRARPKPSPVPSLVETRGIAAVLHCADANPAGVQIQAYGARSHPERRLPPLRMVGQVHWIDGDVEPGIVDPESQVDLVRRCELGGLPQHSPALPAISGSSSAALRQTIGLPFLIIRTGREDLHDLPIANTSYVVRDAWVVPGQ